jgi:hypothetical protein
MGIVSGFRVFVNSLDPTLIDIGAGTGYTGGKYASLDIGDDGSGERISTITSGTTVVGQALADYTSGVKNYISLIYTETEVDPLTEIFYPFTAHDTVVSEDFTVSSLSETDWNLLTVDQKRNRILVAIVTAQGAGNALTSADIQQVVQPLNHPTPSATSNVTGVTFVGIAKTTLMGSATLRFESASKKLFWTAPGDTEGAGVTFTSSSTAVLYSNDTTYWIQVSVVYASLPAADATDTINISSLYGKTIPRFSADDTLHRDLLGSGTPTATNPHGMTLNDIEGGTFDHADLYHKNGISIEADSTQLLCSINLINDYIEVNNIGGFRNSFLVDGLSYETLTGYAAGTDGILAFSSTTPSADYLIYVDSAGAPQKVRIASYVPAGAGDLNVLWSANISILDIHNTLAGSGIISWDGTNLTYQAPLDGTPGSQVLVLPIGTPSGIYKLYSDTTSEYIIVSISGSLGGANSSTFTTDKNETTYADENILKLATVTWNATGELLGNLRDIRQFRTADVRDDLLEEHDATGKHTRVIPNTLKVGVASGPAVYAVADGSLGVWARAKDQAGYFTASGSTNVTVHGVSATARNTSQAAKAIAVKAEAESGTGVWASGVVGAYCIGSAGNGVCASGIPAVYGAANAAGFFGSIGVLGVANDIAVWGQGSAIGVLGIADEIGGGFNATVSGVGVSAYANQGIGADIGAANGTGIYVSVLTGRGGAFTVDKGVYGLEVKNSNSSAVDIYGASFLAINASNHADASAIGVYGSGSAAGALGTGIGVIGIGEIGVSANGVSVGVLGGQYIGPTVLVGVAGYGSSTGGAFGGKTAVQALGNTVAIDGQAPQFLRWSSAWVVPNALDTGSAIPISVFIGGGWTTMCIPIYNIAP